LKLLRVGNMQNETNESSNKLV